MNFCAGTIDLGNQHYVCGNARLGSVILQLCLPLTALVEGSTAFSRFGGHCLDEFLSTWTNYVSTGEAGWLVYSLADGVTNDPMNGPVRRLITLKPGVQVERLVVLKATSWHVQEGRITKEQICR